MPLIFALGKTLEDQGDISSRIKGFRSACKVLSVLASELLH